MQKLVPRQTSDILQLRQIIILNTNCVHINAVSPSRVTWSQNLIKTLAIGHHNHADMRAWSSVVLDHIVVSMRNCGPGQSKAFRVDNRIHQAVKSIDVVLEVELGDAVAVANGVLDESCSCKEEVRKMACFFCRFWDFFEKKINFREKKSFF